MDVDVADDQVVDAYRNGGMAMLMKVFNQTDYLEKLTGLDQLHKESEELMESLDWDEGSESSF
jgi:ubiquitin-like modifier-activating enzyme ATG7